MMSINFLNKFNSNIKPNIFMQEIEPKRKEGIWLQSNNSYEKVSILDKYSDTLQWKEDPYVLPAEISENVQGMISINNKTYFITNFKILEYDVDTNSILEEIPIKTSSLGLFIANETSNELLYFDYQNSEWVLKRYNFTSHTNDIVFNGFKGIYPYRICLIDQTLYIFSNDRKIYTYDLKTQSLSDFGLTVPNEYFSYGHCFYHNNNIYLMGNNNLSNESVSYKLNLTTKSFSQLPDIPYKCYGAAMCLLDNKIYIFGGGSSSSETDSHYNFYIYDILANTYTKQNNFQYPVEEGYATYSNHQILTGSKWHKDDKHLQILDFPSTLKYDNNTIVIINGNIHNTKLLEYDTSVIEGNLLFPFSDIKYYSIEEGEIKTIPTYYGDGSSWIKFKN